MIAECRLSSLYAKAKVRVRVRVRVRVGARFRDLC